MRWGLIPSRAKDPSISARMINARSETAATTPAFGDALRFRRCLIPADGFYEWSRTEVNDGQLFAFAGLWDRWKDSLTAVRWIRLGIDLQRLQVYVWSILNSWRDWQPRAKGHRNPLESLRPIGFDLAIFDLSQPLAFDCGCYPVVNLDRFRIVMVEGCEFELSAFPDSLQAACEAAALIWHNRPCAGDRPGEAEGCEAHPVRAAYGVFDWLDTVFGCGWFCGCHWP
ncbi:MAG: SOS response-associated peptidase [Acidobacteriia bacterium]|nr:SOS response-associated peptidase [Terriglobia bacterium]